MLVGSESTFNTKSRPEKMERTKEGILFCEYIQISKISGLGLIEHCACLIHNVRVCSDGTLASNA